MRRRLRTWSRSFIPFRALVMLCAFLVGVAAITLWFRGKPEKKLILLDSEKGEILEDDAFRSEFEKAVASVKSDSPWPKIGVIDSGLDLELAEREGVVFSKAELTGLDFSTDTQIMSDDLSHGTGLFLALAANRNGFGAIGLVPEATVFPFKLGTKDEFTSGKVPLDRIERAFAEASKRGIHLLTMSLSNVASFWGKREMQQLLEKHERDFLLIVSSGNDAWKLSYGQDCTYIPVCNQTSNLIKVGATDYPYSNSGPVVDLWVASKSSQWRHYPNESARAYEIKEVKSTSAAVPKAMAVAALLAKVNPTLLPMQIKNALLSASHPDGALDPVRAVRRVMKLHKTKVEAEQE